MQGQDFLSSAVSGFAGSLGASGFGAIAGDWAGKAGGQIFFGALSGGIGAELTGGNFWQGAVTGGIVAGLSHSMHSMNNKASRIAELQRKGFTEEQIKSIYDNYLKPGDVSVDELVKKIGGPLEKEYNKRTNLYNELQGNTCALRLSYAMNKAGFSVNGDWIGGGRLKILYVCNKND
ncbi:hypothetical protein RIU44_10975 [Riemerella anatipestifer]|uniref:hypothetical protein n=1 Tax=Riemerella anatipestifer TaxID=34085 RepID=UPI00285879F6|nr:hypothetical protein [Riemerella anatipestifer]MDR7797776.1 hypothetical protein [Riemerella anatipestifer]WRU41931.1 hypothetical protein VIX88_08805 [Riemerella anatipestifer]